jgi:hypothetical protein
MILGVVPVEDVEIGTDLTQKAFENKRNPFKLIY